MFGGTLIVAGAIGIAELDTTGVSRPELKHEVLRPESSPKAETPLSFPSDSARSIHYLFSGSKILGDCETTLDQGCNDKEARLLAGFFGQQSRDVERGVLVLSHQLRAWRGLLIMGCTPPVGPESVST